MVDLLPHLNLYKSSGKLVIALSKLLPEEVCEILYPRHADTFGERMRNLMPEERERLCQSSVDFKSTCLIGSYSQSIPGER